MSLWLTDVLISSPVALARFVIWAGYGQDKSFGLCFETKFNALEIQYHPEHRNDAAFTLRYLCGSWCGAVMRVGHCGLSAH